MIPALTNIEDILHIVEYSYLYFYAFRAHVYPKTSTSNTKSGIKLISGESNS